MKDTKLTEQEIDYNVLNALNLIHPALGEAYTQKGYNPFEEGFVLESDYIEKILEENRDKTPILTEDFLETSSKEVKKYFQRSLQNTIELRNDFETQLKNDEFSNYENENIEKQVKNVILFLQNREQLLKTAIEQLKDPNANSLKLYQDITSINKKLSQLLKESYLEDFKKEVVHKNFIEYCLTVKKLEKMRQEQIAEQKAQEQEQQKQKEQEIKQQKEQEKQEEKQKEQEAQHKDTHEKQPKQTEKDRDF